MALTDNLLAFYKLDDLTDSSGNGNTLTNNGNVTFSSGKVGNAAVFDGSNYLQGPSGVLPTDTDYTVSFWVNFASVTEIVMFMAPVGFGGFCIFYSPIEFFGPPGLIVSSYGVSDARVEWNPSVGTWYNVVVKKIGDDLLFFVDGISIGNVNYNPGFENLELIIGRNVHDSMLLNGTMDSVGFWNRALNSAEIAALYNSGNGYEIQPPAPPSVNLTSGLQAFYKLDDLTDSSGNGNTLTNNGNVTFSSGKVGNAAVFDGSNYLAQESLILPSSDITVSQWLNISSDQSGNFYETVSKWAGPFQGYFVTGVNPPGQDADHFFCGVRTSDGETPGSFVPFTYNEWVNFVIVTNKASGTLKVYKNGVLENTQYITGDYITDDLNTQLQIGAGESSGMFAMIGSLDGVGIWNRALNSAEIAALYNSGIGLELPDEPQTGKLVKFQGKTKLLGKVKFV